MSLAADRLGIDHLSVFAMPPVEFVGLAANLGCRHISLATAPIVSFNPQGYPAWSLREDAALRRETAAALADRGVSIAIAEGLGIMPGRDVSALAPDLDALAELGARRVNGFSIDQDGGRIADQYATLAEMTAARGMALGIEFAPIMGVRTLADAIALIRSIDRPGLGVVVDFMHLGRGGGTPEELAALDPALIAHAQLCDVTIAPGPKGYAYEAGFERLPPGDGELPLAAMLAALPDHVAIGMEIPQRSHVEAGMPIAKLLAECAEKARTLLAG